MGNMKVEIRVPCDLVKSFSYNKSTPPARLGRLHPSVRELAFGALPANGSTRPRLQRIGNMKLATSMQGPPNAVQAALVLSSLSSRVSL